MPSTPSLPPADLLNASFAVGTPEAGWLPPPDSGQPERGKAGCAGLADPVAPPSKPHPAISDGNATGRGQHQHRQGQLGTHCAKVAAALHPERTDASQTAAGGGAPKSSKLSSASAPGLHSAEQLRKLSVGGQHGPGGDHKLHAVTDEQRLFGHVLSSPSSLEQSPGGVLCQLSGRKSGSMTDGQGLSSTALGKSRSLPKAAKVRVEELVDRPDRSVRSDSAPLRGLSSHGSKPHRLPSDTAMGRSPLHFGAAAPKAAAADSKQSHARHRPANSAHAVQLPQKRPPGVQPAETAASKKHGAAGGKVLVPMADDEQPGGFRDRNGGHVPQKQGPEHGRVSATVSLQAAAHKSGKHSGAGAVRANGFHGRPSVLS